MSSVRRGQTKRRGMRGQQIVKSRLSAKLSEYCIVPMSTQKMVKATLIVKAMLMVKATLIVKAMLMIKATLTNSWGIAQPGVPQRTR